MRRRLLAAGLASGGAALLGALLAGCGQNTSGVGSTAPPPAAPLATAVAGPDGTWATVAVGDLRDPTNTFWQLLYRPSGSGLWADDVDATATATNGGIDLAATSTGVVAGVRPSQNLTFSPVIETRTAGKSWIDGVLPAGLAPTPQALAASAGTARTALLGAPGPDQRLVTASSDITTWSQTATAQELASTDVRCGLTGLDAVAYVGSALVAGGACAAPGVVGLFELGAGATATPVGPPVPADATAEVLALSTTTDGLSALLVLRRPGQFSLRLASSDLGLKTWSVSSPLTLGPSNRITSVAPYAGGFLVLTDQPSLYAAGAGIQQWQQLPPPPAGTATVAPVPGGTLSALSPSGTTVTSWDLRPGASAWVKGQTLNVPVLFGSNS